MQIASRSIRRLIASRTRASANIGRLGLNPRIIVFVPMSVTMDMPAAVSVLASCGLTAAIRLPPVASRSPARSADMRVRESGITASETLSSVGFGPQ